MVKKKNKIYLGGSMAGGRDFASGLSLIGEKLESLGFKILSKKTVVQNNKSSTKPLTLKSRKYIMRRDKNWIKKSDFVIAEVSQYSHGVGYEHAWAEFNNKPILFLRNISLKDKGHSAFLDGTDYKKFMFEFYDKDNLQKILDKFFRKFN